MLRSYRYRARDVIRLRWLRREPRLTGREITEAFEALIHRSTTDALALREDIQTPGHIIPLRSIFETWACIIMGEPWT